MSEDTQKVSTAVESSGKPIFITITSYESLLNTNFTPCSTIKFGFGEILQWQNLNCIDFNEKVKFNSTLTLNRLQLHNDLNKKDTKTIKF